MYRVSARMEPVHACRVCVYVCVDVCVQGSGRPAAAAAAAAADVCDGSFRGRGVWVDFAVHVLLCARYSVAVLLNSTIDPRASIVIRRPNKENGQAKAAAAADDADVDNDNDAATITVQW